MFGVSSPLSSCWSVHGLAGFRRKTEDLRGVAIHKQHGGSGVVHSSRPELFVPAGGLVVSLALGVKLKTFAVSVTALKRSKDPKSKHKNDLLQRIPELTFHNLEVDLT